METTISDPALAGTVTLKMSTWGAPKLLQDGTRVPKGPKMGTFALKGTNGEEIVARLKPNLRRTVPGIELDGRLIEQGQPIPLWLVVLAMLPVGLAGVGGALGGLCGGAAAGLNLTVARNKKPTPIKAAIMLASTATATAVWLAAAKAITG
ncbi:MAG: hypothetical protein ACI9WU_003107 [Myxococcota bacterium]|jgi:hypothetical protein